MSRPLRIDFVSDIACPWCAIGLAALREALARVGDAVGAELHFQPFELNPQMDAQGEDADEHLLRKYGMPREQLERNRQVIRERGAALGFTFGRRTRVCNTFAAQRLLHWAGTLGMAQQLALEQVLLTAYHEQDANVADAAVLQRLAREAGLDGDVAAEVLASGQYSEAVRARERYYLERGIHGVPAVIFDERALISGGQPVAVFERALREFAAQSLGD